DILQMQEKDPSTVLVNGLCRTTSLQVMGDIELEFDVTWVDRVKDAIYFVGRFREAVHMIVKPDRYSDIRGAFADLGKELRLALVFVGGGFAILGAGSGRHLQTPPSPVPLEFSVMRVQCNLIRFFARIDLNVPAREGHHFKVVFFE